MSLHTFKRRVKTQRRQCLKQDFSFKTKTFFIKTKSFAWCQIILSKTVISNVRLPS